MSGVGKGELKQILRPSRDGWKVKSKREQIPQIQEVPQDKSRFDCLKDEKRHRYRKYRCLQFNRKGYLFSDTKTIFKNNDPKREFKNIEKEQVKLERILRRQLDLSLKDRSVTFQKNVTNRLVPIDDRSEWFCGYGGMIVLQLHNCYEDDAIQILEYLMARGVFDKIKKAQSLKSSKSRGSRNAVQFCVGRAVDENGRKVFRGGINRPLAEAVEKWLKDHKFSVDRQGHSIEIVDL